MWISLFFYLVLRWKPLKELYLIDNFVTMLLWMPTSFLSYIYIYLNILGCLNFSEFCYILQFARLIPKQWRALLWTIILYDLLLRFCALHYLFFFFLLFHFATFNNYSLIATFALLQAVASGLLLKLPFSTVFEYLQVSFSWCM